MRSQGALLGRGEVAGTMPPAPDVPARLQLEAPGDRPVNVERLDAIPASWTRCVLMLQHTSRDEGNYWIDAAAKFYVEAVRQRVIQLGPGTKDDESRALQILAAQGFKKTGRRLNQEWDHVTLDR